MNARTMWFRIFRYVVYISCGWRLNVVGVYLVTQAKKKKTHAILCAVDEGSGIFFARTRIVRSYALVVECLVCDTRIYNSAHFNAESSQRAPLQVCISK